MKAALTGGRRAPQPYIWGCLVVSLTGWVPMLVFPPLMHGGTLFGEMLVLAGVVVGGYCTLEVLRSRRHVCAKVLWSIWLAPYSVAVLYGLVEAMPYLPRVFSI